MDKQSQDNFNIMYENIIKQLEKQWEDLENDITGLKELDKGRAPRPDEPQS